MGVYRYFMAPAGTIKPDELPAKWGLLEPRERGVNLIAGRHPKRYGANTLTDWGHKRHWPSEMAMLLSGLNRLRIRMGEEEFRRLVHQPFAARQEELAADTAADQPGDRT
jgi:hypothetical protein